MNIAVILAGGCGRRTGQSVPKQFLTVFDIPIIIYTMRNIQNIDIFDEIYVVGPIGWEQFINTYAKQFKIDKFKEMYLGGENRTLSIRNGICGLSKSHECKDIIILVDANRPLISESIYRNSIDILSKCECSVALTPCNDSMFISNNGVELKEVADRTVLYCAQTPESARLGDMIEVYNKINCNMIDLPLSALFLNSGRKVMAFPGSSKSFKITTKDDIEIFKSMIKASNIL